MIVVGQVVTIFDFPLVPGVSVSIGDKGGIVLSSSRGQVEVQMSNGSVTEKLDKVKSSNFPNGKAALISTASGLLVSQYLEWMDIGEWILYDTQKNSVAGKSKASLPGSTASIVSIDPLTVITETGQRKVVINPKQLSLKIGDIAVLDINSIAVLERISTPEVVKPSKRYEIAGLDDLVLELIQEVIVPIRKAGKAKLLGVNPAPGVVLHGIPGTGKTLISKWLAQELETLAKFVKGPELLSPYVGVGETYMRNAFADANAFFNATGKHAIIVFDEAEVAFRKREHHGALSDVSGSLLAQYLGLTGEGASPAIIVMITNHIEMLDEAAYRDGRASVFKVPRPNKDGTLAIAKVHCSRMNASPEIPAFLTERLHADIVLQTLQAEDGINLPIKAGDIVTGAMVSDILDSSGRDALMQDSDSIDLSHVDRAIARNLRKKAVLFQFAAFEEKYGHEILANASGWKQIFTG